MPLGREFSGSALGIAAGKDLLLFLFSFFKGKLITIQEKGGKPQLCSAVFLSKPELKCLVMAQGQRKAEPCSTEAPAGGGCFLLENNAPTSPLISLCPSPAGLPQVRVGIGWDVRWLLFCSSRG